MNPRPKIPTELAAIAALCCLGGAMMLISIPVTALLLLRGANPDPALQALFDDPSLRPLFICEGIGGFILACTGVTAGIMVFKRSRYAGLFLRATIAIAIAGLITDVVIQGWIVTPALRRIAPTLKPPHSLLYDPRYRPALPVIFGGVMLAILIGAALILRRPRVRENLSSWSAGSSASQYRG